MPNVVDAKLRDTPLEDAEPEGLLWWLNREVAPVLRRMLRFLNASWGQNVDVTVSTTVAPTDEFMGVDATSGNVIVNLRPSLVAVQGVRILTVKRADATGNTVTLLADGSDDIDGSSTLILNGDDTLTRLRPRAAGWDVVGGTGSGGGAMHEPFASQTISISQIVPTNQTMLAHDLVLVGDGELVIEGTGEVLNL